MLDVCAIVCGGIAAFYWKFGELDIPLPYQVVLLLGVLLGMVVFPWFGVYESWRGRDQLSHVRTVTFAWVAVFICLFAAAYLTKTGALISRQWTVAWGLSGWSLLLAFRLLGWRALRLVRRSGYNHKKIIVLGAGNLGRQVARRLAEAPWTGFDAVAFLDDDPATWGKTVEGIEVAGGLARVSELVAHRGIDEVWVALPLRAEARMREIENSLRRSTVTIRFVPDIYAFRLFNHSFSEIAGLAILNLTETPMQGVNRLIKAIEDKVLAFVILMTLSPVMLLIGIGVKLSSPGPVFYRQERMSWNGKVFTMLKFRTMPVDVEETGVYWGGAREKRTTRFGSFLRRTSLDELPQFINVLKGEMSIVGPRPERPVFVEKFIDEIPDYMRKHMVNAGITGWAQVNGWRGDTDLTKRIEYDLYYIEHWSLWFDIKILFLTLVRGFVHQNAY